MNRNCRHTYINDEYRKIRFRCTDFISTGTPERVYSISMDRFSICVYFCVCLCMWCSVVFVEGLYSDVGSALRVRTYLLLVYTWVQHIYEYRADYHHITFSQGRQAHGMDRPVGNVLHWRRSLCCSGFGKEVILFGKNFRYFNKGVLRWMQFTKIKH